MATVTRLLRCLAAPARADHVAHQASCRREQLGWWAKSRLQPRVQLQSEGGPVRLRCDALRLLFGNRRRLPF